MQNKTRKQILIFLLQWTSGTAAAFLLYYLIITSIPLSIREPLNQRHWVLISAFGLGAIIGLAQWLVIRKDLPKTALWIPATALAWALTFAAIRHITYLIEINVDFLKLYWLRQLPPFLRALLSLFYGPTYFSELDILIGLSLILGFLLGLAQFAIIKSHIQKATLWIPLNIAASYLSYRLAFTLNNSQLQPFIFFPLHALFTAIAMLYMMQKYYRC